MVSADTKAKVQDLIKTKPVFIASKSYCPYCKKAKSTISDYTKDAYILELDEMSEGDEIQQALYELTGQRTVPNVFFGGQHVGGNSDIQSLESSQQLEAKLKAVL